MHASLRTSVAFKKIRFLIGVCRSGQDLDISLICILLAMDSEKDAAIELFFVDNILQVDLQVQLLINKYNKSLCN